MNRSFIELVAHGLGPPEEAGYTLTPFEKGKPVERPGTQSHGATD